MPGSHRARPVRELATSSLWWQIAYLSGFFGFFCYSFGARLVELVRSAVITDSLTVGILLVIAALATSIFFVVPPLAVAERVCELIRRSRLPETRNGPGASSPSSSTDYGTR
jgi:hypothetical protein